MKALLILAMACLPSPAFAQGSIIGTVRDPSGAPLPGVAVETGSPALIQKTRTAVSDDRGWYRLADLPPGTYDVSFRLDGWQTFEHRGIALTGSSIARIDATLALGTQADVVTVTAGVPIVDVHSVTRQTSVSGTVVGSLPTARSYNALLVLVPGVVTNAGDTVTAPAATSFPIHGGRANDGRLEIDGLTVGSPPSGNSGTSYAVDVGTADEIVFSSSAASGEAETSGLVMNVVPRSGGNTRHGSVYASGTSGRMHADNLTPSLRDQGLATPARLTKLYDISGTLGGPVQQDRAWFFVTGHVGSSTRVDPLVSFNVNAGDQSRWLYAPDLTRPSYSDRVFENASGRLTWQVAPRHRLTAFWDVQALCRTCSGATPGVSEPQRVSPEAVGVLGRPLQVWQATWMSPAADRWLLEAGFGGTRFGVGNFERRPNPTRDLIRVVEQCATGCAGNGEIPGLVYRSQDFSDAHTASYLWKASATYFSGPHSLKVGYQHTVMIDDRTWMTNTQNLSYRFDNGVPNQLTQSIAPWVNDARTAWQAAFVQHQWTDERLTLQGALRFDRAWSWFPVQELGPSRFLPAPIRIPETRGIDSYSDLSVRAGLAYDVFGTGRTAFRVSIGRYLEGAGLTGHYANTNPTLRMPRTTSVFGPAGVTRAWADSNRNLVPDCDLTDPAQQDNRAGGGDLCGVISNTSFGANVLTNNFDPALLRGWGVRPSDWHLAIAFQHQIGARASVGALYTRRSYGGFSVVDNLALQPADLTPFSIVAPLDPRLPGGGAYVVSGLYDVVPEKAGRVDNLVTGAARYGGWSQHFNGLDVTIEVRAARGLTLSAGTSTGQSVADNCGVRASLPELATTTIGTSAFGPGLAGSAVTPLSPYCAVRYGILTQVRGFASFLVPKGGIQVSAAFQSRPGPMLSANYAVPAPAVVPSLGRPLSGNATNVVVNLIEPGTLYGDRINQLDLRVGKPLTFGRIRTLIALDVYNAANSGAVLAYNSAFVPGGPWLQPQAILTPRFARITAEVAF